MYVITMKINSQYAMGEYFFATKEEAQAFLEQLNDYQIDCIKDITKYNKHSFRNAYYDFFE